MFGGGLGARRRAGALPRETTPAAREKIRKRRSREKDGCFGAHSRFGWPMRRVVSGADPQHDEAPGHAFRHPIRYP